MPQVNDERRQEEADLAALTDAKQWRGAHWRETRWQLELARLMVDPVWWGAGVHRGDGSPVLLIPGFLAGDASLSVMASWLRRIGYTPRRSGIAFNVRCADVTVDRLEQLLRHAQLSSGRQVAIVGHSRGGHFARALAVRCPDAVSRVVSLGSGLDDPFDISQLTRRTVESVRRSIARRSPERAAMGCFTAHCSCRYARDYEAPFPESIPLTSVYTKGDGVVRWRSCVVPYAECVQVRGSHVGLAFNRHAYRVIGRVLADGR